MRNEIKALTSLRGVAAFAVVLQHYSATAQTVTREAIPSLAPHGYMAVDFFFVLSGFIMSYTYGQAFRTGGPRAYPDFLARRVARIWPLQAVVVPVLAAIGLIRMGFGGHSGFQGDHVSLFDVVGNILMLQGFGIGANLNGPSGTVSQELGAYVLFPVLLALVFSRRRPVAIAALGIAAAAVCWQAFQEPRLDLSSREIGNNVVRCLAEFTMGIGAYRLYTLPRLPWLASNWLAAGLAAACVVSLFLRVDLPAALLFPFLVVAFARNDGWPARILEARWLYFLGVVSYSLYLVHSPLRFAEYDILVAIHPEKLSGVAALAFAGLASLTSIPLAWACYRLIERPGRDVFRHLLHARPVREPKGQRI